MCNRRRKRNAAARYGRFVPATSYDEASPAPDPDSAPPADPCRSEPEPETPWRARPSGCLFVLCLLLAFALVVVMIIGGAFAEAPVAVRGAWLAALAAAVAGGIFALLAGTADRYGRLAIALVALAVALALLFGGWLALYA